MSATPRRPAGFAPWPSKGHIDLLSVGASALALGGAARWLEWMLVLLIARPMLAFVLVLSDISAEPG